MSWAVVFVPVCVFALLVLVQILLASLYRPRSEDRFIFWLFAWLPLLLFLAGLLMGKFPSGENAYLSYLLFFVLGSSWIASYPAVYASCPTLILSYVLRRRPRGITLDELLPYLDLRRSSAERIGDAEGNGLIRRDARGASLTTRGRVFLFLFRAYRAVLGRKLEAL